MSYSETLLSLSSTAVSWGASYMGKAPSAGEKEKGRKKKEFTIDRHVEPITAAVSLALLGLKAINTKISIEENSIEFDDNSFLQWYYRNQKKAEREDIRDFKIFEIAIEMPQSWFTKGSLEAKAVARIQDLAIEGMKAMVTTYDNTFISIYTENFIKKAERFVEENLEPDERIKIKQRGSCRELPSFQGVDERKEVGRNPGKEGECDDTNGGVKIPPEAIKMIWSYPHLKVEGKEQSCEKLLEIANDIEELWLLHYSDGGIKRNSTRYCDKENKIRATIKEQVTTFKDEILDCFWKSLLSKR